MAKRKTFEVGAEAPEVVDAVDQVDNVELEVPAEMAARVAADGMIPFGEREEVPVILRQKCSVPLAVGECMAVVTLPAGINLDMLAYAIRHGYAGRA